MFGDGSRCSGKHRRTFADVRRRFSETSLNMKHHRGSITIGMGMHRRAVANHPQGIREASANGYWGGIYMPLWGSASFSLWPLKDVHLCVEFKMAGLPFLWTFYISNISIYNHCRTFGEFRECFGVPSPMIRWTFGDASPNIAEGSPNIDISPKLRRSFGEPSANLRGCFGNASATITVRRKSGEASGIIRRGSANLLGWFPDYFSRQNLKCIGKNFNASIEIFWPPPDASWCLLMPPDGPWRPRRFPGPLVNPFLMPHNAHQFPSWIHHPGKKCSVGPRHKTVRFSFLSLSQLHADRSVCIFHTIIRYNLIQCYTHSMMVFLK